MLRSRLLGFSGRLDCAPNDVSNLFPFRIFLIVIYFNRIYIFLDELIDVTTVAEIKTPTYGLAILARFIGSTNEVVA
jgi:hypothetical protein